MILLSAVLHRFRGIRRIFLGIVQSGFIIFCCGGRRREILLSAVYRMFCTIAGCMRRIGCRGVDGFRKIKFFLPELIGRGSRLGFYPCGRRNMATVVLGGLLSRSLIMEKLSCGWFRRMELYHRGTMAEPGCFPGRQISLNETCLRHLDNRFSPCFVPLAQVCSPPLGKAESYLISTGISSVFPHRSSMRSFMRLAFRTKSASSSDMMEDSSRSCWERVYLLLLPAYCLW